MRKHCFLYLLLLTCFLAQAQAPLANFTAAQVSGCAPLVISFEDQSTGSPTTWRWDFGNGSTSTLKNPSTTYFTPGTYSVTLTVSNSSGSNTLTRQGFIAIYGKPTVNFAADRTTGCFPFRVQLTDSSRAAAGTTNTTWLWDLGNGTQSAEVSPKAIYERDGNYNISLRVTNDKGCVATVNRNAFIKVAGGLKLAFTNTTNSRCQAPFPIQFTSGTTGPGTLTYTWDFGNGATSNEKDPVYNYNAAGTYSVALAVNSSNGCTDTLRKEALVNIQPVTTAFTAPDSICLLATASFTNTSSPAPQSTTWRFGDATTAASRNALKSYRNPGLYTVQLLNNYGFCRDSVSKNITVLSRPKAGFKAADRLQCKPPLTVKFEDASTDAASWFWNFGDGQTSTEKDPEHLYNNYGNFNVTLVVTNSSGCSDTLRQASFVQIRKPTITFPSLPKAGCLPFTNTFAANVSTIDNVTSYQWRLGDGTTSSLRNPVHTYQDQGTYPVTLTITTSMGCTDSATMNNAIRVGRKPVVDFTATPNPVCAFHPVQFTSIASEADTWSWNFSGGATSSQPSPVHIYHDTGRFDISLSVTNNGCRETLTKPAFVEVQAPIARFDFAKDCRTPGLFLFTDVSVGGTSWLWDFGDGTTSTEQHPSHVFALGAYNVSLTVTSGNCSHILTKLVEVFKDPLSFEANVQEACRPTAVRFTPVSANLDNKVVFNWTFGNGTSSTLKNPEILFSDAGQFDVSLVTTDIYGCKDSASMDEFVNIHGPAARFTAENTAGCAGLNVRFRDQSKTDGINPITSRLWTFGDGTTEKFTDVLLLEHMYKNPGKFNVKLEVTDAAGCKDSYQVNGLVSTSTPKASFTSADTLTCLGSTVRFTNRSSAQNFTSLWRFGNQQTSSATNATHRYANPGTYNVTLKITDVNGCADSVMLPRYVTVVKTVASFEVSDTVGGCTPFDVRFTNTSQFFQSASWSFAGGTSTAVNPVHTFNDAGEFPVMLAVIGRGGCTDTAKKIIRIFDETATRIRYTPVEGCYPVLIKASITSPPGINYTWDFGDGTLKNTQQKEVEHTYTSIGNFIPRLILSDSGNCLVPFTGDDTVRVHGVISNFGWDKRLFCDSGRVQFLDSTVFNDTGISYRWSFGDGQTASVQNPLHFYQQPGLYSVSLVTQTAFNCRDTTLYQNLVKVVQSPQIDITGPEQQCKDEPVTHAGIFLRQDTSAVTWQWRFPNGTTAAVMRPPAQQYSTPGDFVVAAVAINSSGCTDTASRNLKVHPLPNVSVPSQLTARVGTAIPIQPVSYSSNVATYLWSPAEGLSCTSCPQPLAKPKFNTTYTVIATDSNGCRNTGQVQVIVFCQNANVFVPNTFSPNGDGSNDVFYVRGTGLARVKNLRIFNRLGEIVFERQNFGANDLSAGWDGTYKGKLLAPDTYIYQVDVFCDNSETIRFDGSITLLR